MLQILRKLFAQVKAGNIFGNLLHEIHQLYIFYFEQMKSLKKYITINWIQYSDYTKSIQYWWI